MRNQITLCALLGAPLLLAASAHAQQQTSPAEQAPKMTVEEELKPHPELGSRLLSDLSPEAAKIRRQQLMEKMTPVAPPVPSRIKKQLYDQMAALSGMSMKDLFNFMAAKKKAKEGVTFDEVIESMEIKANDVNFKKVGHNQFWKDVSAISGMATNRVEILQFCDAIVGQRMLEFSPEFSIFIPCRITVFEEPDGDIWLMMLDWDVSWLSMAWHPDSELPEDLKQDAIRIRDAMEAIMEAGANAEW